MMKKQDWSNSPREDLKNINLIESLGWNRNFSYNDIRHQRINPDNVPHDPLSFKQGNYSLWKANHKWIIAYNKNGRYINHKQFNTIMDAVKTFKYNPAMFSNTDED